VPGDGEAAFAARLDQRHSRARDHGLVDHLRPGPLGRKTNKLRPGWVGRGVGPGFHRSRPMFWLAVLKRQGPRAEVSPQRLAGGGWPHVFVEKLPLRRPVDRPCPIGDRKRSRRRVGIA